MSRVGISADNIAKMDNGMLGMQIDRLIEGIIKDICNRPANVAGKCEVRELTLKLKFTPEVQVDQNTRQTELTAIKVQPVVETKIPAVTGGLTDVRLVGGKPMFNEGNPANFAQGALFDEQQRAAAEAAALAAREQADKPVEAAA